MLKIRLFDMSSPPPNPSLTCGRRGEERRGTIGKTRVVAWWRASQQLKTVSTLLIKAVDVYAPG